MISFLLAYQAKLKVILCQPYDHTPASLKAIGVSPVKLVAYRIAVNSGGLPPKRPRTLAAFSPARVRSRINSRSNSANAPKI